MKCEELGLKVALLEAGSSESFSDASQTFGEVEYTNGHHAAATAATSRGLGGSTALWGGRCVTFDDLDFDRREHVPFSGWPIAHSELHGHYREALAFLNCGGNDLQFSGPTSGDQDVLTSSIERWSAHPAVGPFYRDRLRASKDVTAIAGVTVTDIMLDPTGTHTDHLRVLSGGRISQVRAKTYVLAGGGLENTRLLLAAQRDWPEKFGGTDGPLGRFYQGHLTGYIALIHFDDRQAEKALTFQKDAQGYYFRRRLQISPETQCKNALLNSAFWLDAISIADPAHGSGSLSALYLMLTFSGLYRIFSNGLAPKTKSERIDNIRHWHNIRQNRVVLKEFIRATASLFHRRFKRWGTLSNPAGRYLLRYHAEQIPSRESRVFLRERQADTLLPVLLVDYRINEQDVDSVVRSHALLDQWLRDQAIGRLEYLNDASERARRVLDQAFDGYHQIGLTRMSDSEHNGIVDINCRVHDVSNLYLAGSSVFPAGGQANPTLPAVALALRLAHHLAGET
ncbi:hypothetical protein B5P45_22390 [Phyllobacterium zundukense]|uniref:Glucose-methanol-choline oxidoreductase C-terminal domain-containing protein n=1 Tax=Phyllobacterium zundukense TaxID=1867719 RepID=A0A2N9VST0_9HYPH|nr:hypothetical protein B5P45_22390 [Phyllobacterium zundukense]